MLTVPAARAGITQVAWLLETKVTEVQLAVPTITLSPVLSRDPLMVRVPPPAVGEDVGETELKDIDGARADIDPIGVWSPGDSPQPKENIVSTKVSIRIPSYRQYLETLMRLLTDFQQKKYR